MRDSAVTSFNVGKRLDTLDFPADGAERSSTPRGASAPDTQDLQHYSTNAATKPQHEA